ncbi:NADH dehydrogenase [ubiquinone] 1 alpha subcomplex assembly factor 2 isoform X1 [Balaenoptera acutorostrata]|uniref:NADH dehydrogenase [ubiquinone] 1 alpha subcomplex assembly factor 2 isoform X1 n=1 Tax=Balaenoptera acutorostrata TaxID=9767 RepID=A0ABM3T4W3_BALAC|nr:NADH dehydrogenase [ubiquinone] 1 alpha subcomplex assembly factor 2 isoform X1 [Balaenoptera acutorostrata]
MGWSQNLFRVLWRALSKEVKEQVGTDRFGNKYYYIPEYKNWRGQTIREKRIVESANKREIDYEVGDIPTEWEAWIRKTRKTPPTMEEGRYLDSLWRCVDWRAPFELRVTYPSTSPQYPCLFGETVPAVPLRCQQPVFKSQSVVLTMDEEIMKNEKYKEEIKMKTKDFYEKEKLLREESNKEHLVPPVQTQIKGHASAPDFGKEESSVAPTSTGKTFQPGSWMPQDGKSHNQ